jgi:hypothetical protein
LFGGVFFGPQPGCQGNLLEQLEPRTPQWEIAALYARHTPQSPRVLACWGAALQFSLSFFGGDLQPFISLPSTRGHHPEWKMHLGNRGKSASAARLNVEA